MKSLNKTTFETIKSEKRSNSVKNISLWSCRREFFTRVNIPEGKDFGLFIIECFEVAVRNLHSKKHAEKKKFTKTNVF